jgi:hypothetical protein
VVERLATHHRSPAGQLSGALTAGSQPLRGKPSPIRCVTLRLAALSAAVCYGLLLVTPAFADYGAVAYDSKARKQGFAWDGSTQDAANDAARRDCDSDNCQVRFGVPPQMCAALATPDSGPAWGGAVRKSIDAAAFAAIKNCQKHAKAKCIVREKKCTK